MDKFAIIDVKVTPHSHKDSIEGWKEGRLCIRLRQIPEHGKANRNLIEFLADQLDIAPSNISIISGESSRLKRLKIMGISKEEINVFF